MAGLTDTERECADLPIAFRSISTHLRTGMPSKNPPLGLHAIALTHVCRRWRDLLLSYPIIWSHIYVRRDSPESLITTLLQRSRGVPLTVSIQYYSDRPTRVGCGCSRESTWENGDCCPHTLKHMSLLGLLEPFRDNIYTLSVRYLRNMGYDGGNMEDIFDTPFFLKPLPNLESLRWSYRDFSGAFPPDRLSREPFGSSLPRLRKLSMVNCWGLLLTEKPVLQVMSMKGISQAHHWEGVSADQFVSSLRHRPLPASLSLTNLRIAPGANNPPSPVLMKNLKEIALRNVDNGIVFRYTQCPSIGTVATLRIASLNKGLWVDGWSVSITATDGSGGSVSSAAHLADGLGLRVAWEELSGAFAHKVTALEVEDIHLIVAIDSTAIPNLITVMPNLHTVRVQLHAVVENCEALRSSLSGGHGITQVERLVGETENPDEVRRNNEKWEARCVEHQIHDLLV